MAAGKAKLIREGFSEGAAQRITEPLAPSSKPAYESRWKVFVKWCSGKGLTPGKVSIPQLTEFFMDRFAICKNMNTIRGYRSSVMGSLVAEGRKDLEDTKVLTPLFKSFRREAVPTGNPMPKWDLSCVLWSLAKWPFTATGEHQGEAVELKFLSWKLAFLLLLASGARRSEVHAIDWSAIEHTEDWDKVFLHPVPKFTQKTQFSSSVTLKPKVIVIPALGPHLGPGEQEESALCPVNTLRDYLDATSALRDPGEKVKKLFVSFDGDRHHHKSIHANTISSWVRSLIRMCHAEADEHIALHTQIRTHDLRGLATSLSFHGNASMEDILRAGSWATPTTFLKHYLKPMIVFKDNKYRLGPLVAGQKVVLVD